MNLYIVDHFIPFPQSEYGGVWNVIASDDEECFDLITAADDNQFPEYYGQLRGNITKSAKYTVVGNVEPKVVTSFLTQRVMTNDISLVPSLQNHVRKLEETVDQKNKEINNLKTLIDLMQRTIEREK